MKIALVHDYLSQDGGAERVLSAMTELYPNAPIYTLFYDPKSSPKQFKGKEIRESFLGRLPGIKRHYQWLLPLMPYATELYQLSEFDIVLSSTSAFAKGIITGPHTLHLCYCHTPTRYLWTDTASYVSELRVPWFIKRLLPLYLSRLRLWDKHASARVDIFIANSRTVYGRIKKFYGCESHVIFPPVDMPDPETKKIPTSQNYFLTGGRLVAYKRIDLVIIACTRLGLPLIVFGDGPVRAELEKMAGSNVLFVGKVNDEEKQNLYQNCRAFINPQVEDFGITPIEAMSMGRPVIAYKEGGVTETVIEGITGTFFNEQSWEVLADILLHFDETKFDAEIIAEHARIFSKERFKNELKNFVERSWKKFQITMQ